MMVVYLVPAVCLCSGQSHEEVARLLTEGLAWARRSSGPWRVPTTGAISGPGPASDPRCSKRCSSRPPGVASGSTTGAGHGRWRLVTVDGTTLDVPDTDGTDARFGRPETLGGSDPRSADASGGPGRVRHPAITHAAPGPGDLLMADCGFAGLEQWFAASAGDADLPWRISPQAALARPPGPGPFADRVRFRGRGTVHVVFEQSRHRRGGAIGGTTTGQTTPAPVTTNPTALTTWPRCTSGCAPRATSDPRDGGALGKRRPASGARLRTSGTPRFGFSSAGFPSGSGWVVWCPPHRASGQGQRCTAGWGAPVPGPRAGGGGTGAVKGSLPGVQVAARRRALARGFTIVRDRSRERPRLRVGLGPDHTARFDDVRS